MNDSEILLEPIDGYKNHYKDAHKKNTEDFYDDLVKKSGINIDENRDTVKKYNAKMDEYKAECKKLGKQKGLKTFVIIAMIIFIIVGAILAVMSFGGNLPIYVGIIGIVVAVAALIGGIIWIVKGLNKVIKRLEASCQKLKAEADALLNTCWQQMAPLNALFDWGMPQKILTKTVPKIEMDTVFDQAKFTYLNEKYGLEENTDETVSTSFVQSGSILGNPFLICRDFNQRTYNKRYEGRLTIHWTTTVGSGKDRRTVTHTQTLVAYVYKPAPHYFYNTYLIYGNDAAPKLSFSRQPNPNSRLEGKQLTKYVNKVSKKLDNKARNAIKNGGSYTKLGNDEFEALFGGEDRDNEMEFRLLYTPLAQRNVLKLFRSDEGYGDDFAQSKAKCLNCVRSEHSQNVNYEADPLMFISYDYDASRQTFMDYNAKYFKGIYFDFAPLLSVPEYQQHKAKEFIYKDNYSKNISSYEHEAIANAFGGDAFKHSSADTPSILKVSFENKAGAADNVNVTAYAFRAERRLTYVSKLGGDGRIHQVPVYWIEYIPVQKTSTMMVEKKNSSRYEYNSTSGMDNFRQAMNRISGGNPFLYRRGIFAALTSAAVTTDAVNNLNTVYAGTAETVAKQTVAGSSNLEQLMKQILAEQELQNKVLAANTEDNSEKLLNDENAETKEVAISDEELKAAEEADAKASKENTESDDDDDSDTEE